MSDVLSGVGGFVILLLLALAPALLYLAWVRKTERYMTEAWRPLLNAFAYGAVGATVLAALIELILVSAGTSISEAFPGPDTSFLDQNTTAGAFFLVLVIAPFVEEAVKAAGVIRSSGEFRLVADGPVFGASVGLGFGFFETFLYGLSAFLVGGVALGIEVVIIRSFSSVLLHGASSAVFGYGQGVKVFSPGKPSTAPWYLRAVLLHSGYNLVASLPAVLVVLGIAFDEGTADAISLVLAIVFAFLAIEYARSLIHRSDVPPGSFAQPKKVRAATVRGKPPQPVKTARR